MKKITLFKTIVGSQAYGTATEGKSDIDTKGVYIQHTDEIIAFGYVPQFEPSKDECHYEIRRFLELAMTANPTILELFNSMPESIIEKHPSFDIILSHKEKFLTKQCVFSFGGYAEAQIRKAKGLDKKMNWNKERTKRKTPLDFCYIYNNKGGSIPLIKWLMDEGIQQEFCGLTNIDHFRDTYCVWVDYGGLYKRSDPAGFRGISMDEGNAVRLSAVPKGMSVQAIMFYNKDEYSIHCKEYNQYQIWLKDRNINRYAESQKHGQSVDGKNLLHCRRLLDMALEIAEHKTITVRRPNAEELLKIRRGELDLNELIKKAEEDIIRIKDLFAKSNLPESVDENFVNDLLLQVRKSVTW